MIIVIDTLESGTVMRKNNNKLNEKGMTLVEILAAIVLLSIVFVGFMSVFPQMTSFNKITETKLETMNLAKKELDIVKREDFPLEVLNAPKNPDVNAKWSKEKSNKDYFVKVDYYINPHLEPIDKDFEDGQITLYRVDIKVFKSKTDDKVISETYSYIEVVD